MTEHISSEQLLPYLDGELPNSVRQRIGRHLESCWTCRRALDRLEADIGMIVDAQNAVFLPGLQAPPPPRPWPRLEPRLAAAEPRGFPLSRYFGLAMEMLRRPLYVSAMFGALALVTALVWLTPASVSANEVLRRTSEVDARRMQVMPGHFVRQKVRVLKADRRGPARQIGKVDSWRSSRSGYWRVAPSDAVAADLQQRYRRRGIAQHPLCAVSFQSWSKSLGVDGRVVRTAHALDVSFAAPAQPDSSELRDVTLRVRPEDWHITGMRLEFGDADFEIAEEDLALLPRNNAPADVLAHLEPAVPAAERVLSAVVAGPVASPLPAAPAPEQNHPDDLEMDVLFTLHQLGADLGEPITVARGASSEISVQAWGASPTRRELLRRVLQDNPRVRLDLEPPAAAPELVDTAPLSLPRSPSQPERTLRSADEERLVQWFGGSQAKEDFGRSVLIIDTDLLARLYALKALSNRWPRESEILLPDDAKAKLRAMMQDHTRVARQRCSELRLVMKPLLDEFVRNEPALSPMAAADWRDLAAAGLDAAKEADLLLRSQFTTSDTVVPLIEALTGVQRALAVAEAVLWSVPVPSANE